MTDELTTQPIHPNPWEIAFIDGLAWLVFTSIVGVFLYIWWELPSLNHISESITVTYNVDDKPIVRTIRPSDPQFVKSKHLPKYVTGAILVSEDSTFYQHRGIDWFEVQQAFRRNIEQKRYARGASTLTQQVVKNAFLSREKSLFRKLIEGLTALRLELVLSKEQILDYYINLVELGPGIVGIREGARYYFKKAPQELTPEEAAKIAFLLPNPKGYGPALKIGKPSEFRTSRIRSIMSLMIQQRYLGDVYPGAAGDQEDTPDDAMLEPPMEDDATMEGPTHSQNDSADQDDSESSESEDSESTNPKNTL